MHWITTANNHYIRSTNWKLYVCEYFIRYTESRRFAPEVTLLVQINLYTFHRLPFYWQTDWTRNYSYCTILGFSHKFKSNNCTMQYLHSIQIHYFCGLTKLFLHTLFVTYSQLVKTCILIYTFNCIHDQERKLI